MAKETKIDLLIGGSPCVDLACCKQGKEGLHDAESSVFFEFVKIRNFLRRYYAKHDSGHKLFFMLENTASMNKIDTLEMTASLGVAPLTMNVDMISSCRRGRLYGISYQVSAFKEKYDATLKTCCMKCKATLLFLCTIRVSAFVHSLGLELTFLTRGLLLV